MLSPIVLPQESVARMYESIFNFDCRPFPAIPSPDRYFSAESIENARVSLERMIRRDEGPGLIVGAVGTGKSLLAKILAESLRKDYRIALIPAARICSRRSLIQMILHQFGLPFKNMEEGELRLSLIDHVTSHDFCPNGTLLLVDEADSLSMSLLDEMRTMTNTVSGDHHCIRLLLFGALSLEEKVGHPRMESLNQRLAGRFYLEPFNREETFDYIAFQVEQSSGDPTELFTMEALETVYQATNGVPRLINQLCDHALLVASKEGSRTIDVDLMNAAWSELQQLPTPALDRMQSQKPSSVEFGELDDETLPIARNCVEPHESQLEEIEKALDEHDKIGADDSKPGSDLPNTEEVDTLGDDAQVDQRTTIRIHEEIDDAEVTSTDKVTSTAKVQPKLGIAITGNPFDEEFESEELVLDQFIAAKIVAKRETRTVQCERSESLSISIKQYFKHADSSQHESIGGETAPIKALEVTEELEEVDAAAQFDLTNSTDDQSTEMSSSRPTDSSTIHAHEKDVNESPEPQAFQGTGDIGALTIPNSTTESEDPVVATHEHSVLPNAEIEFEFSAHSGSGLESEQRDVCYDPIIVESDFTSRVEYHSESPQAAVVEEDRDSEIATENESNLDLSSEPVEERHIVPIVRPRTIDGELPVVADGLVAKDLKSASTRSYKRLFLKLRKAN